MNEDHSMPPGLDPALFRGLTQRRMSRRDVLRYAGTGAGALGLSAFLAACGVSGTANKPTTAPATSGGVTGTPSVDELAAFWDQQTIAGQLNFANWPYYIDFSREAGHKSRPSIDKFTQETQIEVNYQPVIQGVDTFFATIQPSLAAGQDTGWDIMVITNGTTLDKLIALDYLIPLDHSRTPNFNQYGSPSVTDPSYDPGAAHTMAWQSGYTGIGYNPKLTGREITSINDLNDPAFEGKIGMFADNADLPTFGLLVTGAVPETSTPDQWQAAADWLNQQRPLVRKYYEQGYIDALQNGDTWITMAWSGDIYQSNLLGFPDLKFVIPSEGGALWTDNMCIPQKAQHPLDALTYMDFVYRPDVAALIADWVTYITPVPAAKDIILNDLQDPAVANSPLVFPEEADLAKGHRYYVFKSEEEEQAWNDIFQPIYQS